MTRKLAILGASGHGKVVADMALAAGWRAVVFFDDAWPTVSVNGRWSVTGDYSKLHSRIVEFDGVIVAIGNCAVRWQKQLDLIAAGGKFATLVHPWACVSSYAQLGAGTVVMAGAVINVDALIGESCIVNTGATVDHDCVLANGVHISPGARLSGNVEIGACSWIGAGAVIRQGIRIGAGVTVGAGAVVVKSVIDNITVVGNPAKSLPIHN